jgi:hypothetical protein
MSTDAVFAEPDWDTLVIDYPDLAAVRAYTRYITDHVIRNDPVGRQLPRLAAQAGFRVVNVIPVASRAGDLIVPADRECWRDWILVAAVDLAASSAGARPRASISLPRAVAHLRALTVSDGEAGGGVERA